MNNAIASERNSLRINKHLPIAILYFFFNSFLLPNGMLYTTLLTPFFIIWLYKKESFSYIWLFFIYTIPFFFVHLLKGIDIIVYAKSYFLLFSVFVFILTFYQYLKESSDIKYIFNKITTLNIFAVAIAILAFFILPLRNLFWWKNALTEGVDNIYRLKLLTYEASYYSTLLVPIALYFYIKILISPSKNNKWLTFLAITIPLLLSLSFGVISGILIAIFLIFTSDLRLLTLNPKFPRYILILLILLTIGLIFLIKFFPDNTVLVRIANIFNGKDSSFKGRTFDSIYLAWQIASQKSILFGCGPGQLKIIGLKVFQEFYKYDKFVSLAIPNSIGDTLATYGIVGVVTKLAIVIYFFFKTKVYSNFYRLSLFLFIFIYQFTGSFITNIAEYLIWVLSFYKPLFSEFDKKNVFYKLENSRKVFSN